ncbi:hypothetical protein ACWGHM_19210 [Streptomyces sp. NPDC054904]|uniref:hypothetical protein n=1 Tax=unclassified Streptomyces TaxID=2593676 RepID=UPI0029A53405|nr:hypothetical protein [Streptomyces sp. DK15]MDX2391864.1 hypothetical protein [Streptomyces sp. DK15]
MRGDLVDTGGNRDRLLVERFMEPDGNSVLDDPYVRTLQAVRFWGGLATALLVKVPIALSEGKYFLVWLGDGLLKVALTPLLLLFSVPLVVGVFIASARPGHRGRMRARLRGPLIAVGAFVGHAALVGVAVGLVLLVPAHFGVRAPLTYVSIVVGIVMAGRGIAFILYAVPAASRHMFRTVEVHQALPALLTVVLAWEFAIQSVFYPFGGWPDDTWTLPVGGAMATTAVAAFEIFRLHTRHGVTLRTYSAPRARAA